MLSISEDSQTKSIRNMVRFNDVVDGSAMPIYRQMTPRIEGFVDVRHDNYKRGFIYEGLLIPYMDRNNRARNRLLFIDRRAPEWFFDLCKEISERNQVLEDYDLLKGENRYDRIQVRMRLANMPNHEQACMMAFLVPCAQSIEQVYEEWETKKAKLNKLPRMLSECGTLDEVAYFIFDYAAIRMNLRIIRRDQRDMMDDSVITVSSNGVLVKIVGAMTMAREPGLVQKILDSDTSLDYEVSTHIKHFRVVDRRGL